MKNIVIDTCVFIHIIRETITGNNCLEALTRFDEAPNIIISVVSKAELESFIVQNNWGRLKIKKLNKILNEITYIDISNADGLLIDAYTQIDGFSKRKIKDKAGNFLTGSARKMGKNDLFVPRKSRKFNARFFAHRLSNSASTNRFGFYTKTCFNGNSICIDIYQDR